MKRINLSAVVVLASSLVAAPAMFAAPAHISTPVHAMFSKSKMVKFTLRNDSTSEVDLEIDDASKKVVALAPGKKVDLNLAEGTRIVASNDTPNHATGSLIEQVVSSHGGATISIH